MAQLEPETQIAGVVVIMDFENLSLKQVNNLYILLEIVSKNKILAT